MGQHNTAGTDRSGGEDAGVEFVDAEGGGDVSQGLPQCLEPHVRGNGDEGLHVGADVGEGGDAASRHQESRLRV